jgi:hypothetical protein
MPERGTLSKDKKDRAAFQTGADSPARRASPSDSEIRITSNTGQIDERTSLLGSEDGRLPSRTFTEEMDREDRGVDDSGSKGDDRHREGGTCVFWFKLMAERIRPTRKDTTLKMARKIKQRSKYYVPVSLNASVGMRADSR